MPMRGREATSTAAVTTLVPPSTDISATGRIPTTKAQNRRCQRPGSSPGPSRRVALDAGVKNAFDYPGFVPAYIRPLFCRGTGPFRWVALSGDPEDIRRTDAKMKELFPEDAHLHRWLDMAGERIASQGLPARICWIGLGERHRAGLAFNEMVRRGELKAPIVIGRDHLDSGSVASPLRSAQAPTALPTSSGVRKTIPACA